MHLYNSRQDFHLRLQSLVRLVSENTCCNCWPLEHVLLRGAADTTTLSCHPDSSLRPRSLLGLFQLEERTRLWRELPHLHQLRVHTDHRRMSGDVFDRRCDTVDNMGEWYGEKACPGMSAMSSNVVLDCAFYHKYFLHHTCLLFCTQTVIYVNVDMNVYSNGHIPTVLSVRHVPRISPRRGPRPPAL